MQQMILLFWYLKDDDLNYCGRCCQLESWRNDFFVPSFLIVRRCILYCWRFVSAVLSTNDGMIWYDVCCTAAGDAKMPDASQSSQVDDRTDLRCYSYTETWKIRPRPRQWMDSVGWVNLMNLHWRKCTRGAARTICRLDSWRRWLLASLFESPHQWWYNRFGSSLLIISLLFAVLCRWYYYSQPCWLFFRFRDVLWAVRTSLHRLTDSAYGYIRKMGNWILCRIKKSLTTTFNLHLLTTHQIHHVAESADTYLVF